MVKLEGLVVMSVFWLGVFVILLASRASAQANTCASDDKTIKLPQDGLCLEIVQNTKDWLQAQIVCEQNGGNLFRLGPNGQLLPSHYPVLGQCLGAMSRNNQLGYDFWIGAASAWSRHWFWVNDTLLNPIRYVTTDSRAFDSSQTSSQVCSTYLSVDYCVSLCLDKASAFTILHRKGRYPCCFCSFRLNYDLVNQSQDIFFNPDSTSYYIAASGNGRSITVRLTGSETYSNTETMCAVVDSNTSSRRELQSRTCFSEHPFLCSLGKNRSIPCDSSSCNEEVCRFLVQDECVERDSRAKTWFQARFDCQALGGDLWTVSKLADMYQVNRYLQTGTLYWVGATDHYWSFTPESQVFRTSDPDYEVVRCGHMFLERSGITGQPRQWKWSDTRCDQHKSFICQYELPETHQAANTSAPTVVCPWVLPTTATLPISSSPTPPLPSSSSSPKPTVFINPTPPLPSPQVQTVTPTGGIPVTISTRRKDHSALIAIIAACIAALVILLCAIFMLCCGRRRKWLKKWMRTRDHTWPFMTSSSRDLGQDLSSEPGFDSFSNEDTCSVFTSNGNFILSDQTRTGSRPRKGQALSHRTGSIAGSRRNESFRKDRLNTRSTRTSKNAAADGSVMRQYSTLDSSLGHMTIDPDGGLPLGTSFTDEQLTSASYASLSPRAREYMTLSARMEVPDDPEVANPSTSKKPEVVLVTNDVDLNFTVNHVHRNNRTASRLNSEGAYERGYEEVDGDDTVQISTCTVEDSIMHL